MKNQTLQRSRRFWLSTVFVSLFAIGFAPRLIAAPDPRVIEAAKKEGQLMWYNTLVQPHAQEVISRFMQKYPFVRATFVRGSANRVHTRLSTEARAGRYDWDVVSLTDPEGVLNLKQRRLIVPYKSSERDMFGEDVRDREGYWTGYYALATGVIFNTKAVRPQEVPKTYEDLLLPKWSGNKISIDTEGNELLTGLRITWGKQKALAYLQRLAAQQPVRGRGNNARIELAAAGEFPLAIAFTHTAEAIKQKGGPIEWTNLEPVVVQVDSLMLGARAPHPNTGRLFIDFLLAEEGQSLLQKLNRPVLRTGVDPIPARLSKGYQRVVLQPEHASDRQSDVQLYKEIFGIQ
jgi:ABC-type Fe3+ transport system substrate-binding protein